LFSVIYYGHLRGKQRYRCSSCYHQFVRRYDKSQWVKQAYRAYVDGKQTLTQLSQHYHKNIRTIQRQFNSLIIPVSTERLFEQAVNLIVDATFFSRTDGVLVFRAKQRNLYWRFITTETIADIAAGLDVLELRRGYRFKSVVLDGRKGVIKLFETRYPGLPIQLCQFHQAQIVRRYTTNRPKTECGQALKCLMLMLTQVDHEQFSSMLFSLHEQYEEFLKERNEQGQFMQRRLRSAFRSLKTNLPYLFTYKQFPILNMPNTTNSCEGSFAHWKQKVKIHRGLRHKRRNKMINYLLNKS